MPRITGLLSVCVIWKLKGQILKLNMFCVSIVSKHMTYYILVIPVPVGRADGREKVGQWDLLSKLLLIEPPNSLPSTKTPFPYRTVKCLVGMSFRHCNNYIPYTSRLETRTLWSTLKFKRCYLCHITSMTSTEHPSDGPTAHVGPWPPLLRFRNSSFLWCGVVSPTPNPQTGGLGLCIYDPRRQSGPVIPPGTR
jgi:hypothetical protein